MPFIYVYAILIGLLWTLYSRRSSTPEVPYVSSSRWLNLKDFNIKRTEFLDRCRAKYGRVFRFGLGHKRVYIVASNSLIKSLFADSGNCLEHKDAHFLTLEALGSRGKRQDLAIPVHQIFLPSLTRALSQREVLLEMGGIMYSALHLYMSQISTGTEGVGLVDAVGRTAHHAIAFTIFGPSFPILQAWEQFNTLDSSIPLMLSPLRFLAFSGCRARDKLLNIMKTYIIDNQNANAHSALIGTALRAGKDILPLHEQAVCLLSLYWAAEANLHRSVFWLTVHVLNNEMNKNRLREETRQTLLNHNVHDLRTLIFSHPDVLAGEFPLTDSAAKEALRLSSLSVSLRRGKQTFMFPKGDGTFFTIPKDSLIMPDTRAVHFDDQFYPDAKIFKLDRFLTSKEKDMRATPKTFVYGGGAHLCKGRYMSHHFMKLWIVVFLDMFEAGPVDIPAMDPMSWNSVAFPNNDVYVKLSQAS